MVPAKFAAFLDFGIFLEPPLESPDSKFISHKSLKIMGVSVEVTFDACSIGGMIGTSTVGVPVVAELAEVPGRTFPTSRLSRLTFLRMKEYQ